MTQFLCNQLFVNMPVTKEDKIYEKLVDHNVLFGFIYTLTISLFIMS